MQIVIHPRIPSDVEQIITYYRRSGTAELADEFYAELRRCIVEAGEKAVSVPVRGHGLRRVNLRRFPYHFLFRIVDSTMRILVVRHHRRHPSFGTGRR